MKPILSLLCLTLAFVSAFAALPKSWKACSKSTPNYDKCLIKEIQNALSTLYDGNRKMGLPPLEPLRIDKLTVPPHGGPVSVDLAFTNFDVFGIKDLKLKSIKNDWKTMEATANIPLLKVKSNYKVTGKVLVLPIVGDGKCNITLDNLDLSAKANIKEIDQKGKKYFQMETFKLTLKPKAFGIYLENLFNGDKALGENMNKFIEENSMDIFAEMKPSIESGLAQAFLAISNRVLIKIPADELNLP